MSTFRGLPRGLFEFFTELQADNPKSFWQANKHRYEHDVRTPVRALLDDLSDEFGSLRMFRPNRDVRFSKDKSPYKLWTGATSEAQAIGMLMHGILASMAEFYSLNLAQEVLKGMTQKATMGGTPAKAPLGYLNVRTTDAKGHEIRDVTVDPERADLITFAFTAYATGDWTLSSLATELEARGLTTRPCC